MNKDNKEKNNTKGKIGIVVSDKMDKTVVVKIDRLKMHPIYRKKYKISKKYKAHDAENKFKIGDKVKIIEVKPMSKEKKWIAKGVESL
ncbi:MAG: 30S ribosomal protein S17 [Candidatus Andersenbacteria bacterium]|nr:30S ribosomal protein S17 [Candidatus Andersenbacteria bacterium]